MKIAFVIGTLKFSGAEKIARFLIKKLYEDYGHEIFVLLTDCDHFDNDFSYVGQYIIKTKGTIIKRVRQRQKQIKNISKKENFDIVISFGSISNIDVIEALLFTKIPVIICERNDPVNDPSRKILRIRRRISYPFASGYIFQTETIANYFGSKIKKKGIVIPNFIEKHHEYLYNDKVEDNIVITARLKDSQKNISSLITAFKDFHKTHNSYKLYIVGDGPDYKKYKSLIEMYSLTNCVFLTGRQDVYKYLNKAKIFVLSSIYEGMPNSLIEAMACGIPCISTNCSGGGATSLINDHVNGTIVPVNDHKSLTNALCELADNNELRKKYSLEAYKINETLEINKIVNLWNKYICKTCMYR